MIARLFGIALAIMIAAPVLAEEEAPAAPSLSDQLKALLPQAFNGYRDGDAYWDRLVDGIKQSEASRPNPCREIGEVSLERTILHEMITMPDGAAHPDGGIWQERLVADRCGRTGVYNLLFIAGPEGAPELRPMIQGLSAAIPGDQGDIAALAASEARERSGCESMQAVEAAFLQFIERPEGARSQAPLWAERWRAEGCGEQVDVLIALEQTPIGRARIGLIGEGEGEESDAE